MPLSIPPDYTPTPRALREAVILVTGAGAGLGRALALMCASLGATVILLGRTVAKLEASYDAIESGGFSRAAIYPLDLAGASARDYQQMALSIETEFGRLNGLVHCAASLGPLTPLAHYPAEDWLTTLHSNLTGPVLLSQACLSLLMQPDTSSLIFTVDDRSCAYWGAYGVSKAALQSAMRIFADELDGKKNAAGKPRLCVNAVRPGAMRTHIRRSAFPGENLQSVPMPDRYLSSYLYLLDPTTDKPNGALIEAEASTPEVS